MAEHMVIDLNGVQLGNDPSQWSSKEVKQWLRENGFKEVETNLNNSLHTITGQQLLSLNGEQLQQTPFCMTNMHEIDHLQSCIQTLRNQQLTKYMKKGNQNGYHQLPPANSKNNVKMSNGHTLINESLDDSELHEFSKVSTPLLPDSGEDRRSPVSSHAKGDLYPPEMLKTFLSFLYMMFGFVLSVFMLQIVHERVPPIDVDPPLPDVFFDIVPDRIVWAFSICEWSGMILTAFCAVICIFHKHRFIITRRIFFIMGTLYLYRCVTTFVTTLPVPGFHFKCASKVNYKLSTMISRAAAVLSGGGLTVTGAHNYCGDYLFSGHTIILVMTYLSVTEYSPKRWWWLHWMSWLLAALGIICILLAHDHYTVDVVVAYLLTTRLFWTYHTMCNTVSLKELNKSNLLSRAWWFSMFRFFEGNVNANGPLPRQYEWPLPWPKWLGHSTNPRWSPLKMV